MDTVVFVEPKVIDYFTNEMVLAQVNGDVDTVTAKEYHISGYPTAVMLTPQGKEIDRIVGYAPPDEYLKTLQDYQNGIGTLDDLLNKAKDSSDRNLYFQIADKYKYRGGPTEAAEWYKKVIAAGQPTDSLSGESRISLADMERRAKNWDAAIAQFQSIATDFVGTPFAETADIYTAIVYTRKGDTTQAIASYQKFLEKYPTSEDTSYAQKQIEKLKNPPAPKETKSGS